MVVEKKFRGGWHQFQIALLAFVMGASGIAFEYTFSKLSADLLGSTVVQWAVVIALMMLFMGIGADQQKHVKSSYILPFFVVVEIILSLLGAFGPLLLIHIFGALRDYYVLVQYLLIAGVGLIVGLEIPLLLRLNEKYTEGLAFNLSSVLRLDYLGAFCGALLWIFFVVRYSLITHIGFIFSLANLTAVLWTYFYFVFVKGQGNANSGSRKASQNVLMGLLLVVWLVLGFGAMRVSGWTVYAEQRLFRDKVILSYTTPYQHIVLTERSSGEVICYINGNTQFSSKDEYIYHEMLVHPAMWMATERRDILILGGGDGLALREVLKYDEVKTVTLVDIDPQMTSLARTNKHFVRLNRNSLNNKRVHIIPNRVLKEIQKEPLYLPKMTSAPYKNTEKTDVHISVMHMDALQYVEQIPANYDVIIIDFPDPNHLDLSKLYSLEFYLQVQKRLRPAGVIVTQSTSPTYAKEVFLCIGRTLKASGLVAVPFHETVPTFGDWSWWLAVKPNPLKASLLEATATLSSSSKHRYEAYDAKAIRLRQQLQTNSFNYFAESNIAMRYLTPNIVDRSLIFGKNALKTDKNTINTLLNKVIFRYYLQAKKNSF